MTLTEKAMTEKRLLENEIQSLTKLINESPKGRLQCFKNGKYFKYYMCCKNPRTGKIERRYVQKKNTSLIGALANKAFNIAILKKLKKQLSVLNKFIIQYTSLSPRAAALSSLPAWERSLISPPRNKIDEELAAWEKEPFTLNPYYPEYRNIPACDGLFVRSKSEAYIATVLKANGIPFRYDSEIQLNGQNMYPDFVIRHPLTGELFLWEHWGLLDQQKYKNRMMTKMHDYISAGFLPMANFIMTSEAPDHPLPFGLVDALIDYYFL